MSPPRLELPAESTPPAAQRSRSSRRWWWVVFVGIGLSSAVAGAFLSYPPPHEIVESMWPVRTKLLGALRRNATDEAARHVAEWERLIRKLPVANILHGDSPSPSAQERTARLEEALGELREALAGDSRQVRPLAIACFELHRDCAATYRAAPPKVHEPAGEGHKHALREVGPGDAVPTVTLSIEPDFKSGWNIHIETTNFRFAPEHANGEHVPGEGHAHLYVDGRKVTRLYDDWYYLPSLPPGRHTVRVTLNTNDHYDYAVDGESIAAETTVEVGNDLELVYFGTQTGAPVSLPVIDPAADDICRQPSGLSPTTGAPASNNEPIRTTED